MNGLTRFGLPIGDYPLCRRKFVHDTLWLMQRHMRVHRSERTRRDGQTHLGGQRWRCTACRRRFTARSTSAFSRHAVPDDLIALAVRHAVRYRVRYADVVEWRAEWGISVHRSTVYRWVHHFLPFFREAAHAHRHPVRAKWRVDETYIRVHGRWTYVYRAIDQVGQVGDVYFSERRNATAAQAFFQRAITETKVRPERVTTDKARCYPPVLRVALPNIDHRCSRYLNNAIERDHGHLKQRLRPMRGFKSATSADILARGHALIQHVRNGFSRLTVHLPATLRLALAWQQLTLVV
jgi:transposase-like protein